MWHRARQRQIGLPSDLAVPPIHQKAYFCSLDFPHLLDREMKAESGVFDHASFFTVFAKRFITFSTLSVIFLAYAIHLCAFPGWGRLIRCVCVSDRFQ